jgi:hypothetical protein
MRVLIYARFHLIETVDKNNVLDLGQPLQILIIVEYCTCRTAFRFPYLRI